MPSLTVTVLMWLIVVLSLGGILAQVLKKSAITFVALLVLAAIAVAYVTEHLAIVRG